MTDLVEQWIAALESGEYEQGAGQLAQDGYFCCLGVLCEVADVEYNGSRAGVTAEVMDLAGLASPHGSYGWNGAESLAQKNDDGFDFIKIAEIIRSRPEGLFT